MYIIFTYLKVLFSVATWLIHSLSVSQTTQRADTCTNRNRITISITDEFHPRQPFEKTRFKRSKHVRHVDTSGCPRFTAIEESLRKSSESTSPDESTQTLKEVVASRTIQSRLDRRVPPPQNARFELSTSHRQEGEFACQSLRSRGFVGPSSIRHYPSSSPTLFSTRTIKRHTIGSW